MATHVLLFTLPDVCAQVYVLMVVRAAAVRWLLQTASKQAAAGEAQRASLLRVTQTLFATTLDFVEVQTHALVNQGFTAHRDFRSVARPDVATVS